MSAPNQEEQAPLRPPATEAEKVDEAFLRIPAYSSGFFTTAAKFTADVQVPTPYQSHRFPFLLPLPI
jgi:hypothetical protein